MKNHINKLLRPHQPGDEVCRAELATCGLWDRLKHPKTVRHATALSIGGAVCFIGSLVSHAEIALLPKIAIETLGFSIHGLGLVPFCSHVEPLWSSLTD